MSQTADKLPLKSIKLAKYNPRKISPENLDRLKKSIKNHSKTVTKNNGSGFRLVDPLIINDVTGNLVGGHQRVIALKALKQDWVHKDDIRRVYLEEKYEPALNVALNNPLAQGEWDGDKLKIVIDKLKADGVDIEMTAFGEDELMEVYDPEPQEDEAEITMKPSDFKAWTFYFTEKQFDFVKAVLSNMEGFKPDKENPNVNGNKIHAVVREYHLKNKPPKKDGNGAKGNPKKGRKALRH